MGQGTIAPTFFTDAAVKPFNPVPPTPAGPPPQKQQAGGSPIHDFVVKNPTATPEQVQAQFPAISLDGIKAILPGVKQDVLKTWVPPATAPQGPPPNAVQQSLAPIAPPPPSAPSGMPLNAFTPPGAPGYEPMGKPQVFPQAVSNTPPPPPQGASVAPGPPPDAMAARQATLAGIPGYKPGALSAPGEGGVGMQSGSPMQGGGGHGGNSFLDGLKRFAPALALALATKNNPQVGASILGGINSAQQRMATEKAQQDAIDRQQAQLDFTNKIAQQEADAKTKAAATALTTKEQAALSAIPTGAGALAFYDSIDPTNARGLRDTFMTTGADGKQVVKEANPFSKDAANNASKEKIAQGKLDAIAQHYGEQAQHAFTQDIKDYGGDPDTQKAIAARYDKQFKTTDFTDSLGELGTGLTDKAKIAKQRADDSSAYVKAHIKEIIAATGLKGAQTDYYKLTTPERVKVLQATADFLSNRSGEVVPLAEAEIAYKGALGQAAGINADAHMISSTTGEGKTGDQSSKSVYGSKWGKVYDEATDKRDKAAAKLNAFRNQKDGDGNLVNKGKPDPPDLVEPVERYDRQIERMNTTSPPSAKTPQGKQTPRSMAYKSGNTFGGSKQVTIDEGRKLGAQFGFTDIGGRRAEAKDPNGHPEGLALDFMIHGDDRKGQELANYLKANYKDNNVKYIIYKQHIWNPSRASEGWRLMEDRGSPTANHMDHVHVTFKDNAGGSSSRMVQSGPPPSQKTASNVDYHSMSTADLLKRLAAKVH